MLLRDVCTPSNNGITEDNMTTMLYHNIRHLLPPHTEMYTWDELIEFVSTIEGVYYEASKGDTIRQRPMSINHYRTVVMTSITEEVQLELGTPE